MKRPKSEKMQTKKRSLNEPKKINPFEVHKNREKFKILGRKNKHDHGLPGVSRGKAVKKRKETLGKEFNIRNKTNKFLDRRIRGNISNEEISELRFTELQKTKFIKSNKKDLFNLNDEEILTHRGQTVNEIEQFEDEVSDVSEDEALDADFTKAAHFGGGNDVTEIDRKTAIEDMIIESKRRKAEILKEKEEVLQLTSVLDENYRSLLPQLGKLSSNVNKAKQNVDEYDRIMREMIFEPRGEVTDKLKSKEEIEKKERDRLEKLEKERLARMKGDEAHDEKPKHVSADDLGDGYLIESDEENNGREMLAYDINGKSNIEEALKSKLNENNENGHKEDEDELEEEDDDETEENDDLIDLKYVETSDEENGDTVECKEKSKVEKIISFDTNDTKQVEEIVEMPSNFNELLIILQRKNSKLQGIIIEKIIQYNHPKLESSNRLKIAKLFGYLLQYVNKIFTDYSNIGNSFKILNQIMPQLFDIVHLNVDATSGHFSKIIKEKYEIYKTNMKKIPNIETIILFKIISNLYSTSDFRHLIVTPTIVFISQILTRSNVRSRKDIALALFLVTIVMEFTYLSKRFLPAAFIFLLKVINFAIPKKCVGPIKISPLKSIRPAESILCLTEKHHSQLERKLDSCELVSNDPIDDNFKIATINMTLELIKENAEILIENVGSRYIAEEFEKLMEQLPLDNYPEYVKQNYAKAKCSLDATKKSKLSKLVAIVRKPKALRLFEPRIEKVCDDKRRRKMSAEKQMHAIMVHKIKRETKGAEREIRRDTQFLNKIKIKQQIRSDVERKEKVKRIFAEASVQQGELNTLQRERKKNKF